MTHASKWRVKMTQASKRRAERQNDAPGVKTTRRCVKMTHKRGISPPPIFVATGGREAALVSICQQSFLCVVCVLAPDTLRPY